MPFDRHDDLYDDAIWTALETALRDVWQVLKAHELYPNWNDDPELKQQLSLTLMALVDAGVRDTEELRSRTLASFPLPRSN